MRPDKSLPYLDSFNSSEEYIQSLLDIATTDKLLLKLCGGVHILDFFANTPDLYSTILDQEWRDFIQAHEIMNFLDFLMREPLDIFDQEGVTTSWRNGPLPPASLLNYVREVRKHLLVREPYRSQCTRNRAVKPVQKLAWHVSVGMKVKKVHEVGLFASFIDQFTASITDEKRQITHLIDFGSGKNYLGRALASKPYSKHIVAIERRGHNQERAKVFDQVAGLREKERFKYDGKAVIEVMSDSSSANAKKKTEEETEVPVRIDPVADGVGTIQYVEHDIEDGNLKQVISEISNIDPTNAVTNEMDRPVQALVMSLHSCGNLVHHGLRSLIKNDEVKAVAMVGCCYNLITERLSPPSYKIPNLRPFVHPRVEIESMACDPHGFPMSERLCKHVNNGVKLNITARSMAVQAPQNWGEKDSDGFFTRHFYRALLQLIFLDKGVVGPPRVEAEGGSPLGHSSGTPIVIGSLRKQCYASFMSYVRGALAKLTIDPEKGQVFKDKLADLADAEIEGYEARFIHRKKDLSAIWSLMAFSAGIVEALIIVDRYLWLKEQDEVGDAWVEPIFDYAISPRNLVVIGVKK